MAVYQLQTKQKIRASIDEVWDFISSPKNLQLITPDYMGFEILGEALPDEMYEGIIIRYTLRPIMGIPLTWVTEISHIRDKEYFVDEQKVGPYALWHHQHQIKQVEDGVEMTDIVTYSPPFGILGKIANALFIRRQLKEIFDYREKAVEQYFHKEHAYSE